MIKLHVATIPQITKGARTLNVIELWDTLLQLHSAISESIYTRASHAGYLS